MAEAHLSLLSIVKPVQICQLMIALVYSQKIGVTILSALVHDQQKISVDFHNMIDIAHLLLTVFLNKLKVRSQLDVSACLAAVCK